jgi:O-antigen/teichoic acid export membrane protein
MSHSIKIHRYDKYFNTDHLRPNLKQRAIKGSGATVFTRISVYGSQLIGTMILARLLIPGDFGLVAMVTVFANILIEFGILRLADATIQREQINHQQISTLFWINVTLCTALSVFLVAVSSLVAFFYQEPRLTAITMVIAIGFIFTGVSIQHMALLQRNMEFYKIAAINITSTIFVDITAVVLAWQGCGYWALVARRLGIPVSTAVGLWILCKWRPGPPSNIADVWPMLKFGINSLGNYTMDYLSRSLDKVLLGWRYDTQTLGYYERAYHLFVLPVNQLSYPLTSVVVATLSRLNSEPEKFRNYYLNAVAILAFIGMLLSVNMTMIGKDLILLLLGSQWEKAGQIFSLFGPGIGIMLIYGTNGWLHLSLGRPDRWFRWGVIAFVTTAIFFVIGLTFGGLGIAIAYVASFYVLIVPCLLYAGRPINLKLYSLVSAIWKYFVAALVTALICWVFLYLFGITSSIYVGLNTITKILVSIFLSTSLYLLLVVALYRSTKPISKFVSLLRDMFPNIFLKKSASISR